MAGNAADQGRSVTAKLAAILASFTSGSVQQLTELARHSGLPVSTTHRLAAELTATEFLQRSSGGGFRIGPALRDLTDPAPRPPTLVERAPHVVEDLVEACICRRGWACCTGWRSATSRRRPATSR